MKGFWGMVLGAIVGNLLAHLILDAGVLLLWLRGVDWANAGPIVVVGTIGVIVFAAGLGEWLNDRDRRRAP